MCQCYIWTSNIRCVETQAIYCCNALNVITMMNFHWKHWGWVEVACASYIHGKDKQIWYQWNICWHKQGYVVHTITAQKLLLKTLSLNDHTYAVCAKYILRTILSMNLLLAQIGPYCTHVWPLLSLCLPRHLLHKQLMSPYTKSHANICCFYVWNNDSGMSHTGKLHAITYELSWYVQI